MSLGLPIVATSVALEGIQVEPGRDVLVADAPLAFVTQVGRLIERRDLREELGRNARRIAVEKYGWRHLGSKFEALLARVANRPGGSRRRSMSAAAR